MDTPAEFANAALFADLGMWLGLLMSLFLFSVLLRDNLLARLAQHVLTGAVMGYLALLVWHDVLLPRLVVPLADGGGPVLWLPGALAFILLVAGLQRIAVQPDPQASDAPVLRRPPLWERGLFNLGRIPVAILVGVGLGTGIVGALEGTFWPQYLRAAQIALEPTAPMGRLVIGLLTLALTTGVMLHLYLDPRRFAEPQPGFVRRTLLGWMWVGRHALWLAVGMIFAHIAAARMSVLIAQVQSLIGVVAETRLLQWVESWLGR